MNDRTVIVTSANSGMGLATTVQLAREGAHVIMACRSAERGAQALAEAQRLTGAAAPIELILCDLGSLAGIHSFAEQFSAKFAKLDVLVNNAGVVTIKRQMTTDGFEAMMGVNHLGHFLLTNLLLPQLLLAPEGRVVTVSSGAHKVGKIDWSDPYLTKGFSVWRGYGQSKLANILFTKSLAQRLKGTNAIANCVHPGAVSTNLGVSRETGFGKLIHTVLRPFFQTSAEGARTAIHLASSPEVTGISGEYFYKLKPAKVSALAQDTALADKLWAWSESEVGLR
ncbi:SDR family oxidoreductase [Paenibacillus mendelii]|uniref:SDR family oxidoreductase n=1 Tax=Paenibacillus mendelii TaxID=206163 RepID=A0ABV6J454_9BACL|nr:SDR family oxidoreductase [Paenibacillus mendelii]MCQ6562051.1 SDR family oxidoreductase [Paenibacillus mendelii]